MWFGTIYFGALLILLMVAEVNMETHPTIVAHSCAHYDGVTGGFRWNDDEVKK